MTDQLRIASVQFEHAPSDKAANLATMSDFVARAAEAGCAAIAFPEMCVTGYTHLTEAGAEAWEAVAESLPDGPSTQQVAGWAREHDMLIAFGLVERAADPGRYHNTYVVCTPEGEVHRFRKLHAFENSCVQPGDEVVVFDWRGWKIGILICYDNNLPENVRLVQLAGAELVLAPHQTGGFDIEIAGMGRIPHETWRKRHDDPEPMRQAIVGPQGREWLLKWLPARAYDHNVFYVFSNGVGIDGSEVRTGNAMIIDNHGIVLAESSAADNDLVIADLDHASLQRALGRSHALSRRPELYGPLAEGEAAASTWEVRNAMTASHKIG